jgi:hypothetical protein
MSHHWDFPDRCEGDFELTKGFKIPRHWADMSNPERFETYENLNRQFAEEAKRVEDELNQMFSEAGCSMRMRVIMHLVVDPNDDPRLPGKVDPGIESPAVEGHVGSD